MNPRKLFNPLLLICMLMPGIATSAVTAEDFMVKTTKNLINLCTASTEDPHYQERGYPFLPGLSGRCILLLCCST
jgi:hypothetical protein